MSSREPVHPEEILLLDYLVGQLPPETSDQVRRHVAGCRACRRTIADLSLTVDELDRLPTVVIPHDAPAGSVGAHRPPRTRLRAYLPGVAVILIAITAFAALGLGRDAAPPPRAATRVVSLGLPDGVASLRLLLPAGAEGAPIYQRADHDSAEWIVLVSADAVDVVADRLQAEPPGGDRVYVQAQPG
jgi:anti-sigma factor RsiW